MRNRSREPASAIPTNACNYHVGAFLEACETPDLSAPRFSSSYITAHTARLAWRSDLRSAQPHPVGERSTRGASAGLPKGASTSTRPTSLGSGVGVGVGARHPRTTTTAPPDRGSRAVSFADATHPWPSLRNSVYSTTSHAFHVQRLDAPPVPALPSPPPSSISAAEARVGMGAEDGRWRTGRGVAGSAREKWKPFQRDDADGHCGVYEPGAERIAHITSPRQTAGTLEDIRRRMLRPGATGQQGGQQGQGGEWRRSVEESPPLTTRPLPSFDTRPSTTYLPLPSSPPPSSVLPLPASAVHFVFLLLLSCPVLSLLASSLVHSAFHLASPSSFIPNAHRSISANSSNNPFHGNNSGFNNGFPDGRNAGEAGDYLFAPVQETMFACPGAGGE
ncbi:hypothetical protein B0H11DRAFT_2435245 [Mycena galericulata]|nr:hypothetical protein B0H11DRAFT_2435245 [Mycena galericulata]